MSLIPRHSKKWFRNEDLHGLCIAISDVALTAASDGTSGEVELRRVDNLVDARLDRLVEVFGRFRILGNRNGHDFVWAVNRMPSESMLILVAKRIGLASGGLGIQLLRKKSPVLIVKSDETPSYLTSPSERAFVQPSRK